MVIKLAVGAFIVLLLLTALYIWHQRNGIFLTFDAGSDQKLSKTLSYTSIALLIESVIGVFILFLGNKYLNLITLALASLTLIIFSIFFNQKN